MPIPLYHSPPNRKNNSERSEESGEREEREKERRERSRGKRITLKIIFSMSLPRS
jgi:hypothetical protein